MGNKKIFILIVGLVGLLISCEKCVECSHKTQKAVKMCEKDAGSSDEYDKTIKSLETIGYTCTQK